MFRLRGQWRCLPLLCFCKLRSVCSLWCHTTQTLLFIYEVRNNATRLPMNSRKPKVPEYITLQLSTSSTHRLTTSLTKKITNPQTYKVTKSQNHQLTNSLTQTLTTSSTHQLINSTTYQLINFQTPKLKYPSIQKRKLLYLFYKLILIFAPFQRKHGLKSR